MVIIWTYRYIRNIKAEKHREREYDTSDISIRSKLHLINFRIDSAFLSGKQRKSRQRRLISVNLKAKENRTSRWHRQETRMVLQTIAKYNDMMILQTVSVSGSHPPIIIFFVQRFCRPAVVHDPDKLCDFWPIRKTILAICTAHGGIQFSMRSKCNRHRGNAKAGNVL